VGVPETKICNKKAAKSNVMIKIEKFNISSGNQTSERSRKLCLASFLSAPKKGQKSVCVLLSLNIWPYPRVQFESPFSSHYPYTLVQTDSTRKLKNCIPSLGC
jgi:hypothetical protein